jgi:dTDP-4-amino-4,6-dideoxygalactose transaminase
MYVSRDAERAERAAHLRAFGIDRSYGERALPGQYDVVALGLNYRMSELQAALGSVQLTRLGEILARRRRNFTRLKAGLGDVPGIHVLDAEGDEAVSSHYCLGALLPPELRPYRNDVLMHLKASGVGTSVYYPHPVNRFTYYRDKYGYDAGSYPHAEAISDGSVALPVGPHLNENDIDYIVCKFQQAIRAIRP